MKRRDDDFKNEDFDEFNEFEEEELECDGSDNYGGFDIDSPTAAFLYADDTYFKRDFPPEIMWAIGEFQKRPRARAINPKKLAQVQAAMKPIIDEIKEHDDNPKISAEFDDIMGTMLGYTIEVPAATFHEKTIREFQKRSKDILSGIDVCPAFNGNVIIVFSFPDVACTTPLPAEPPNSNPADSSNDPSKR